MKEDGSLIFSREELLDEKFKVLSPVYPLSEHQFDVLIREGGSRIGNLADKVFCVALGVLLQVIVLFVYICYYHFTCNKLKVDDILAHFDKIQIGLLVISLILSGILKIVSLCVKSEKMQLISEIKSHFKK